MGAQGVALFLPEAAFEERAEDDGLDIAPVVLIGGAEQRTELGRGQLNGVHRGEETAVEVVHAGVAAGAGRVLVVHLAEESADEVIGGGAAAAFIQQVGEDVPREQADVLGEHSHHALEDEAAGADAVLAARDQRVEGVGDIPGGFAGDVDPVMREQGLEGAGEQEIERGVAFGQVGQAHLVHRLIKLRVEVVNPELVEVAERDVRRAVGDEVEPVIEGLLVVFGELDPARFHLNEGAARPDEISVLGPLAGHADAVFEGGALGQGVGVVPEGGEQVQEKDLGFALFVALELGGKLGELAEGLFLRGHEVVEGGEFRVESERTLMGREWQGRAPRAGQFGASPPPGTAARPAAPPRGSSRGWLERHHRDVRRPVWRTQTRHGSLEFAPASTLTAL